MEHQRLIDECAVEMQGEFVACEPEPGSWGRIQFWTADDLHRETPFGDAEIGERCARDEDTQGFGLVESPGLLV